MKRQAITTLGHIHERCNEVGECWEWARSFSAQGTPACRFDGKHETVFRASFMLAHTLNREDIMGLTVWPKCKNQRCVKPDHLMCGTRAQMIVWRGLQGLCKLSPAAKATATRARRARGVKFTMDEIRAIREAPTTEKQEGALRGVSGALIGDIRRHEIYRESVNASSIFTMGAQLMAAA